MKYALSLFTGLLLSGSLLAQPSEFKEYSNGLIYSPEAISQLQQVSDSLNLAYRQCRLNPTYLSLPQTRAQVLSLEGPLARKVKTAIEQGISYQELLRRYPSLSVEEDRVVVLHQYPNYQKEPVYELEAYGLAGPILSIYLDEPRAEGPWVFDYSPKQLTAFYLSTPLKQQTLPEPFAGMVQYADCMVDTTAQIYIGEEGESYDYWQPSPPEVQELYSYVDRLSQRPDRLASYEEYAQWDSLHWMLLDKSFARDQHLQKLMAAAAEKVLQEGGSDNRLEAYLSRYYSKELALQLKRQRRVVGSCSMDLSPRFHAVNIALLSADLADWQVFLRAHLDIMNDRFDRMSDGSYAYAGRQTYIKELEELRIDIPKLLMGISLRYQNATNNHYFGSISRLGRAMAESREPALLEQAMLKTITNPDLDGFNRLLGVYLYLNYLQSLELERKLLKPKIQQLAAACRSLPGALGKEFPSLD